MSFLESVIPWLKMRADEEEKPTLEDAKVVINNNPALKRAIAGAAKAAPVAAAAAEPVSTDPRAIDIRKTDWVNELANSKSIDDIKKLIQKNREVEESTQKDIRARAPESSEWAKMRANVEQVPGVLQGRADIADLEKRIAGFENAPQRPDLSMLAPFTQSIYSEFGVKGPEYKAPMTPEEREAKAFALKEHLMKLRQGYTDKEADLMKAQLSDKQMTTLRNLIGLDTTTEDALRKKLEEMAKNKVGGGTEQGFKPEGGRGTGLTKDYRDLKEVKDLQKKMDPLIPMVTSLKELDDVIGGIDTWKGEEIPGTGATGKLPHMLLTAKGKKIRQLVTDLSNDITKAQSGQAVSAQEADRLKAALGTSLYSTDESLINGLRNYKSEFYAIMADREAPLRGAMPHILDLYHKGRGTGSEMVKGIGRGKGGGGGAGEAVMTEEKKNRMKALQEKYKSKR